MRIKRVQGTFRELESVELDFCWDSGASDIPTDGNAHNLPKRGYCSQIDWSCTIGQMLSEYLPGWNSLSSVTKIHSFFELAGIVCVGLLVVAETGAYLYGGRRETLLGGANISAVREELEAAKAEVAKLTADSEPRKISVEQSKRILSQLSAFQKHSVTIRHSPELESQDYSDQIAEVLRMAGWTIIPPPFEYLERSAPGVKILVRDLKTAPIGAGQIQHAFKLAGVEMDGGEMKNLRDSDITIWVGPKVKGN